jgi:hypothetical protein
MQLSGWPTGLVNSASLSSLNLTRVRGLQPINSSTNASTASWFSNLREFLLNDAGPSTMTLQDMAAFAEVHTQLVSLQVSTANLSGTLPFNLRSNTR